VALNTLEMAGRPIEAAAGLAKAPDPIEFFLLEGRGHTDSTLKALISTKHACRCVSVTAQSWAPTTGHQAALVGVATTGFVVATFVITDCFLTSAAWNLCSNLAFFIRAEEALWSVLRAVSIFHHLNHLSAASTSP
jgi:hypothetical protein